MKITAYLLILCSFISFPEQSAAKPLYDTLVYFPETDSYYELVSLSSQYPGRFGRNATGWQEVNRLAVQRVRKSRRGRLAIVSSKKVHDFLRKTFRPEKPAWIGLRFFCKYNTAMWVNGQRIKPGDFRAWANPWNLAEKHYSPTSPHRISCANWNPVLPVHYWGIPEGFLWNGNVYTVHWSTFFVEYPAQNKSSE